MEYEYSYKVKSLEPYIEYCEKNGYELKKNFIQEGREWKSLNNTLARIKIDKLNDGTTKKVLDFKDDDDSVNLLKERRESKALEYTDDEAVASILEYLGYNIPNGEYVRTRFVYEKGGVKFEMDFYHESKNKVLGVEGEKEAVDAVYLEIKDFEQGSCIVK